MSEIKKITVSEIEFTFVNSWRKNRSGFVHETQLFKGSQKIAFNKSQYYNRTWESYEYQSSMRQAVYCALDEQKSFLVDEYKRSTGKKKLTEEQKAHLADSNPEMIVLQALLHSL